MILDDIIKENKKSLDYTRGFDRGFKDGFDQAKKRYRSKDFYDPLGEEEL